MIPAVVQPSVTMLPELFRIFNVDQSFSGFTQTKKQATVRSLGYTAGDPGVAAG